jgi:hypothetical protein
MKKGIFLSLITLTALIVVYASYSIFYKELLSKKESLHTKENTDTQAESATTSLENTTNTVTVATTTLATTTETTSTTTPLKENSATTTLKTSSIKDITKIKEVSTLSPLLNSSPFTNTKHLYTINLPKGWTTDPKKGNYFIDAMFLDSKVDKVGTLEFRTNINTGAVPLKTAGISDLDHCVTAQKLAMLFKNYTSTRDGKEIVHGTEVRIIGGIYDYGEYHLQNVQLLAVKNGLYYDVTATMLASEWSTHKEATEASLRSLVIQ